MDRTRQEELRALAADLARKGIGQAAREADELLAAVPELLDYVQALEAERAGIRELVMAYEDWEESGRAGAKWGPVLEALDAVGSARALGVST